MTKASDLINTIAERKGYSSYLEIGCYKDATFNRIEMPSKIGVDPESGGTRRMTSDVFFSGYKGAPFDLIFIDGLHTRDHVLHDTISSISNLSKDGVILIHDCLPKTEDNQYNIEEFTKVYGYPPPGERSWNGDVWKAMVTIRTWEKVDSCVLDLDWGFGLIKHRPNQNLLKESLLPLLNWDTYFNHGRELLRVVNRVQAFELLGI